jgi:hypothetical protein
MARMRALMVDLEDVSPEQITQALRMMGGGAGEQASIVDVLPALGRANGNGHGHLARPAPKRRGRPPKALAPPAVAERVARKHRAPHGNGRGPARRIAPSAKAVGSGPAARDAAARPAVGIQDRVLAELRKDPASSQELYQRLGVEPSSVYNACRILKGKGYLEPFQHDDSDGVTRWRLTRLAPQ